MNDEGYTISSGNVFADAGLPDAEELLMKADLLYDIATEISRRRLTKRQAASLLGIPRSDVSRLLRPRLSYFSLERLQEMSAKLGMNVAIS
jgi:predicted XRE-type DNA-binding protein